MVEWRRLQGLKTPQTHKLPSVNGTIHRWIETGELDRDFQAGARGYSPRFPMPHKLAPNKAIVEARLEALPKLSAKRLFDKVRAAGYAGCYARVSPLSR